MFLAKDQELQARVAPPVLEGKENTNNNMQRRRTTTSRRRELHSRHTVEDKYERTAAAEQQPIFSSRMISPAGPVAPSSS